MEIPKSKNVLNDNFNDGFIPVHIGLMGHIDAGKTAVASVLSEIVSTAGLDKHPQAQKRGITIDIGFTFFPINEFMVTLVDAPGHADLIKSVVSAAAIIDLGILVIDAVEGPQIQTGEHLVILDLMKIPFLIVLINKIDLVDNKRLEIVKKHSVQILKGTNFENNFKLFCVSAIKREGFGVLKEFLLKYFRSNCPSRKKSGSLEFLFDHHFLKSGLGTVLTGTVIEGSACEGDQITILPPNLRSKIKSIQKWKTSSKCMTAGDRCGVLLSDISPRQIYRGCFATNSPESYSLSSYFLCELSITPWYKGNLYFGQQLSITLGMFTIQANIYPVVEIEYEKKSYLTKIDRYNPEKIKDNNYHLKILVSFPEAIYFKPNTQFLLSRLDLPPKQLRIVGLARIINSFSSFPILFREKWKKGYVKNPNYSSKSVIVEGLASNQIGAQNLIGKKAEFPFGKVLSTFGRKGNVEIEILKNDKSISSNGSSSSKDIHISVGTEVRLKIMKELKLKN